MKTKVNSFATNKPCPNKDCRGHLWYYNSLEDTYDATIVAKCDACSKSFVGYFDDQNKIKDIPADDSI